MLRPASLSLTSASQKWVIVISAPPMCDKAEDVVELVLVSSSRQDVVAEVEDLGVLKIVVASPAMYSWTQG